MILKLKAKHFLCTNYSDNCNCVIVKAIREELIKMGIGSLPVVEKVNRVSIGNKRYFHASYDFIAFSIVDTPKMTKAIADKDIERVIREIEIPGLDLRDFIPTPELSETTIDKLLREKNYESTVKSSTF